MPVWRQLVTLPRRVSELESRLAAMEDEPLAPGPVVTRPSNYSCDGCFGAMNIIGEEKLDRLDVFGQVVHKLECSECGRMTRKMFTAGDGYI